MPSVGAALGNTLLHQCTAAIVPAVLAANGDLLRLTAPDGAYAVYPLGPAATPD